VPSTLHLSSDLASHPPAPAIKYGSDIVGNHIGTGVVEFIQGAHIGTSVIVVADGSVRGVNTSVDGFASDPIKHGPESPTVHAAAEKAYADILPIKQTPQSLDVHSATD
jgi:hypothetical protein